MDIHGYFQIEIQKLYDTESQLIEGLTFMATRVQDEDLRDTLNAHKKETIEHARRLEHICQHLGCSPMGEQNMVVRTLIDEARQMFSNAPISAITDACIIGTAQKAEHLEMASYGTALALAGQMEHEHLTDMLRKTLDEEKEADKKLTKLAEHGINKQAVELSGPMTLR